MNTAAETTADGKPGKWHLLSRRQRWAIGVLLVLAVIALLAPSPFEGRMARTAFDLFHFPAFAAISWLGLRIGRRLGATRLSQRLGIASTILVASAIMEGLQSVSGRSATWHDLIANMSGVAAGWMLFEAASGTRRWLRYGLGCAALTLWLAVCYGPALVLHDLWKQYREFPLIGSFESDAELTRWRRRNTNMSRSDDLVTDGHTGLALHIHPGNYPAISHMHLPPDWSTFSSLQFDWCLPSDSPVAEAQLLVRVADRHLGDTDEDTFHRVYRLPRGGTRHVEIPMRDIQQGSLREPLDVRAIRILEFQFLDIKRSLVVHFDNVRLVP